MRKITFDEIEKVHKYTLNLINNFGFTRLVIEQTYGDGLVYRLSNYYVEKRTFRVNGDDKPRPNYISEGIVIKANNLFPEKEETNVFVDEEKVKI